MNKNFIKLLVLILALASAGVVPAAGTLDFYWIDMEGGGGTLIVTPAKESVLIDTGNAGSATNSSAARIHKAAMDAGISKIDYLILTHFHTDHYGGAGDLAKLMPIGEVLDNGIPEHDSDGVTNNDARWNRSIQPYRDFKADSRMVIEPGEVIPLKQSDGAVPLSFFCVGTRKEHVTPSYVPTTVTNPVCADEVDHALDTTDNANSVVMLLKFGAFKFFDGGDLTWNMEAKLVCPFNPVGTVDLYQVDHHGLNLSNNPLLVRSLSPTVTVMSNGPHKGAMPQTLATLRSVASIKDMWQIHRNTLGGQEFNTDTNFIANMPVNCDGNYIKCSVDPSGKSYTISIPATGFSKTYATVLDRPY
jgi:beta-lactamase superfamily II metal-dependent hydrolase